jgi:hypothetical protein
MVNRTGTYFAFDGLGETDPAKSDFKYYVTVQGWSAASHIEFKFVDSHDKASAVRDSSKLATLQASIRERLAGSKNMVIIVSGSTRTTGSVLSWEVEKAVDYYDLPLIIAYAGCEVMTNPEAYSSRWPETLASRIQSGNAKAIHIPFKKDAMLNAIRRFDVNGEKMSGSLVHYSEEAHRSWGYL